MKQSGIKVVFNNPAEFMEELAKDRDYLKVKERIVRVTARYCATKTMPIQRLEVVATYRKDDIIVELVRDCGDIFVVREGPADEESKRVSDRAFAISEEIKKHAISLGLETRPGVFTFAGD